MAPLPLFYNGNNNSGVFKQVISTNVLLTVVVKWRLGPCGTNVLCSKSTQPWQPLPINFKVFVPICCVEPVVALLILCPKMEITTGKYLKKSLEDQDWKLHVKGSVLCRSFVHTANTNQLLFDYAHSHLSNIICIQKSLYTWDIITFFLWMEFEYCCGK